MEIDRGVNVSHSEQEPYPDPRPQWTSATPYQELQVDQIRLIRIEPLLDPSASPLLCTLKTFNLMEVPSFRALSYTWGIPHRNIRKMRITPASKTRHIVCNEKEAQVGENLYDFLAYCACSSNSDLQGYLWIDALCINQGIIQERSEQVKLMGSIYQKASEVFIWLGPEDHSTRTAFALMEGWLKIDESERLSLHPSEVRPGHPNFLLDLRSWQALARFFQREWFGRSWILQEIVFANAVTMLCGIQSMSWADMGLFSHFLATSTWTILLKNSAGLDQKEGHITLNHNTPARLRAARRTWLSTNNNKFLYALIRARSSKSEDPRDKVYSQLGLGKADIFPDYTASVAEVYITAAKYVLEHSPSLLLLTCVEGEDFQKVLGLPSWVPDWSFTKTLGLRITGYPQFCASLERPKRQVLSTDDDGTHVLSIEAVKLDEIVDICESKADLRNNIHESHLWDMLSKLDINYAASPAPGQRREEALWRALMTNRGGHKTSSEPASVDYPASPELGPSFRTWVLWRYALLPVAPRIFPSPSSSHDFVPTETEIRNAWQKAKTDASYLADLARGASVYDLHYLHAMQLRPFCTKLGYLGIGTQCLGIGDSVWIAPGCPCPLILRRIEGKERYRLVGGSYVHGFMKGEAMQREDLRFEMVSLE